MSNVRTSAKPVRKCHGCLLNLGDHCWHYRYPRGQWRHGRTCSARDNTDLHAQFREWQEAPTYATRRELRQRYFRTKRRKGVQAR